MFRTFQLFRLREINTDNDSGIIETTFQIFLDEVRPNPSLTNIGVSIEKEAGEKIEVTCPLRSMMAI